MEWTDIVKIILGTGLLSAILNSIISHYLASRKEELRERGRVRDEATLLAIKLATILEEFAHECQNLMINNQNYFTSGGAVGRLYVVIPKIPDYPDKSDWKCLQMELVEAVFSFRNEVKEAQYYVDFEIDVNDNEAGANEFILVSKRVGAESLRLAEILRERYGLPKYKHSSDLIEVFSYKADGAARDIGY